MDPLTVHDPVPKLPTVHYLNCMSCRTAITSSIRCSLLKRKYWYSMLWLQQSNMWL